VVDLPRFDGTGPRGQGPITGRGEGYCAIRRPEPGQLAYGYVGQQGRPVRLGTPPLRMGSVPDSPVGRLRRRSTDVRSDTGAAAAPAAPAVGEASSRLSGSSMVRMKWSEVTAVDVGLIVMEGR
jgi:hypothetical protein